jgi:hypothetical protein
MKGDRGGDSESDRSSDSDRTSERGGDSDINSDRRVVEVVIGIEV